MTNLLHNASLTLGKGNVSTRLVANELDLNLATLAAALLVIIIIIIASRRTLALDSTGFRGGATVSDRVRIVEVAS